MKKRKSILTFNRLVGIIIIGIIAIGCLVSSDKAIDTIYETIRYPYYTYFAGDPAGWGNRKPSPVKADDPAYWSPRLYDAKTNPSNPAYWSPRLYGRLLNGEDITTPTVRVSPVGQYVITKVCISRGTL